MKKFAGTILAAVLLAGVSTGCAVPETDDSTAAERAAEDRKDKKKSDKGSSEKSGKPEKAAPEMTAGQENAMASAENYLDLTGFSREGLIEQLVFEEYSKADATFAVDQLKVNFNEQAALSAENYLDMTAFSRQGLIDQLKFEGYTEQQSAYGVKQAGL